MIELRPGLLWRPGWFDPAAQEALLADVRDGLRQAPLFIPTMPRTNKPFSVRMSNRGALGWVSDVGGYRYQPHHPVTGRPWPPMPEALLALWRAVTDHPHPPEACLVNYYASTARMGLHQDRDEADLSAPVVSVSLGATALFRYALGEGQSPTRSVRLESGDVVVIGGPARLCFHGVDRLYPGTSTLVPDEGRVNLTLRRVNVP